MHQICQKIKSMKIKTTDIAFLIRKFGLFRVTGKLTGASGDVIISDDLENNSVNVSIPVKTIDTGNKKRDKHLLNADFFHVDRFPEMLFVSTDISKHNDGFKAVGTLTILGISNPVSIRFTKDDNLIKGQLTINRQSFKLGKLPGFVVGNQVEITFTTTLTD